MVNRVINLIAIFVRVLIHLSASMSNPIPLKAGLTHNQVQDRANEGGSAACLKFPTRPTTPENVRIYRKSYFSEPGKRIIHSGKCLTSYLF